MVKIVNVGTARRRASPLSGLSEGLSQGIQAGIDVKTLKQRERERKSAVKASENKLASDLASQQLRKKKTDIENVRTTHEQFSLWWNDMDAQHKAIAKSSDQYKEMQKFFKSFSSTVPGLIADNGDIVPASNQKIFQGKLEEMTAQARISAAKGTATKTDLQLIRLDVKDVNQLSSALASATRNVTPSEIKNNPGGFIQGVKNFFSRNKPKTVAPANPNIQGLAAPVAPVGANAPQAANPNTAALADPFNILGKN